MDINGLERLKVLLTGKRLKISVAESLTCGRLQAALGSISGASEFFEGGVTAYNLRQKIRLLAVDKQHAQHVNSVSQRLAFELAGGACILFQTDIGIGTTGYAEPNPDNGVYEPTAYFAICRRNGESIENIVGKQVIGAGLNRLQMQERVTAIALEALLSYAENCRPAESSLSTTTQPRNEN